MSKTFLTERKNPHTPVHGVKEFVRLSFTKDYLIFHLTRTKTIEKKFSTLAARAVFVNLFFLQKQLIFGRK